MHSSFVELYQKLPAVCWQHRGGLEIKLGSRQPSCPSVTLKASLPSPALPMSARLPQPAFCGSYKAGLAAVLTVLTAVLPLVSVSSVLHCAHRWWFSLPEQSKKHHSATIVAVRRAGVTVSGGCNSVDKPGF